MNARIRGLMAPVLRSLLFTTLAILFCGTGQAGAAARGLTSGVYAVTVGADGSVFVGGTYDSAGGKKALCVAKWDGKDWSALGSGIRDGVITLAAGPDGSVYAGGWFTEAGDKEVSYAARWDGKTWRPMGNGPTLVRKIITTPKGSLYAIGDTDKGESCVMTYANGGWLPLGQGFTASDIAAAPDGTLYATGSMTGQGAPAGYHVVTWTGSQWRPLGGDLGMGATGLAVSTDGTVYVCGVPFSKKSSSFKKWTGSTWVDTPAQGTFSQLVAAPDGSLYGIRSTDSGREMQGFNLARWDGAAWTPLTSDAKNYYDTIAVGPDNALYVVGSFRAIGKVKALNVAKWDGKQWTPLGAGVKY